MSRRPIHSDSRTLTSLRQGLLESYVYEQYNESNADYFTAVSVSTKSKGKRTLTQQLMSSVTIIVLWFSKLLEFLKLKTVRRREYHASNECERRESRWYNVWQHADRCLNPIYLFMVKAFLFDSWLLSQFSKIRRWLPQQKGPKVLWIALLPLLILTGTGSFSSTKPCASD